MDDESRWDERLPEIIWGMNNSVSGSTGVSPSRLMFGHCGGVNRDLTGGVEDTNLAGRDPQVAARQELGERRIRAGET